MLDCIALLGICCCRLRLTRVFAYDYQLSKLEDLCYNMEAQHSISHILTTSSCIKGAIQLIFSRVKI
jgi:hypothetical protein